MSDVRVYEPTARLREIRERTEKAIPAPWFRFGDEISKPEVDIVRWAYWGMPPAEWPDAEASYAPTLDFIAAARSDVPWLLDEVARLRKALKRISRAHASAEHLQTVADEALAGPPDV